MESQTQAKPQPHILVLPCPLQGHINPMLQFSKRLASKGPRVTLVATSSISKSVKAIASHTINIEIISDGSTESITLDTSTDSDAFFENFKVTVSQSLIKLIETQKRSRHPPKFVVYDSGMPWALNLARELGLDGAPFFTQSGAVNAIYYHGYKGTLKLPLEEPTVSLPSLPLLGANDLPSFMADTGTYRALFRTLLNQLSNIDEANWIFCNTVYELEDEVLNWMTSQWPVKTIGPTIPSIYLDKRLEDDKEYGLSLFKPEVDACLKWLDTMEAGSVIYISFGSLASLEADQMEELTLGLKNSNCHFLWVVRDSEHKKLPANFVQETTEKGLVVSWCNQLEVLAHKAIGCFMTHCGWNSTLEALSLGVPMVAMPQWTDQRTNAKFIVDVWKVGVRIKLDEKGLANKEEIELCIREIMEGESGKEMKTNSVKWKKLAIEAVDEGGSSDKNIEGFVEKLQILANMTKIY
ncbi:mogroside IE synthase [Quercus suber]|uniref:mogroside IE synthase n=1 Tax=Quercus suber TaxID=58331 RepID=UPI000CE20E88|nr:UDP-glycosyltransferase 74E1-like [Quercus suber]